MGNPRSNHVFVNCPFDEGYKPVFDGILFAARSAREQDDLPRFNMEFALGLLLGCERFGDTAQRRKVSLILDSEQYRYRTFISDIAGQDTHAHQGQPENAIREVRRWLAVTSGHTKLPGGNDIANRFRGFRDDFPDLCTAARLEPAEVTFKDLQLMIVSWLRLNR